MYDIGSGNAAAKEYVRIKMPFLFTTLEFGIVMTDGLKIII